MAASHEKLDQALKGYSVVADKEHKRSRSAAETRCAALRLVAGWVLLCFVFVGYVVVVGVGFVGLLVLVVVVVVVVVIHLFVLLVFRVLSSAFSVSFCPLLFFKPISISNTCVS